MKKNNITKYGLWLVCALTIILFGCASLKNFLSGSTTSLKSGSLARASALRAMGVTIAGTREGSNWAITPTRISGEVMSVVLPCNGQEDEGIVAFGQGRPDIAPAQSTLYHFDLSEVTTLRKDVISLKPGYTGGTTDKIILLFGYFDVTFDHNGTSKRIRMVYGDTSPYVRGDKLLYNASGETTGKFYWYNTSTESFVIETGTRPTYPAVNTYVRNFSDLVRPNMHYYMLGANLKNNTDYDGSRRDYISLQRSVVEDHDLSFTVDFDVQNAVIFTGITSGPAFDALSDAELIQKFDMRQNTSGWENSGLDCSISFESRAKY